MDSGNVEMIGSVVLIGIALCASVIGLVVAIYFTIGGWKMFAKAGQPGWAILVPIYNLYVLVKMVGLPMHWFYYLVILAFVGSFFPAVAMVTSIGTLVLSFYVARLLLRAFGQSDQPISVIITMFFPFILIYRAGFGSARYLGPQSLHDIPNLPWLSNTPQSTTFHATPPPPPAPGNYIPTLSAQQPDETPLVNNQPMNIPPVSGGSSDPGVDMGSLPQMGSSKDQQQ